MKSPALRKLRAKLADDQPTYGMWVTLESPSITEIAVALGLDWVVVDAEHGHLDWHDVVGHVRAAVRSDTVVIVRLAELNGGLIKRALDIGADGVVIPWIESAEQLEQAVAWCRYPPTGRRGIGGERATGWGGCLAESVAEADEHVIVMPLIESVEGGRNIEAICQVEGADLFYIGPADFSATAGYPGEWQGGDVADQILMVNETVRRHNKHCGVICRNHEEQVLRAEQGFRLLGLGLDSGLLIRSLRESLAHVGISRSFGPTLTPRDD